MKKNSKIVLKELSLSIDIHSPHWFTIDMDTLGKGDAVIIEKLEVERGSERSEWNN